MKKICVSLVMLAPSLAMAALPNFGVGDLAVLQVGDGVEAPSNTGNSVFIDDFSTAGALINSFAVPNTGASALLISGSGSSEGNLSLSPDGTTLAFAGYNVNVGGSVSLSAATSASVPRAYGSMSAQGAFTLQGTTTTQFSGNNIRTATTDGQNNFWLGGGVSGTFYAGNTTTAGTVQSAQVNSRVLSIQNGNLYFSVGSGSGTLGIYGFTGVPTGAATPTLILATGQSSSPDNFVFSPDGNTLYIADDSKTTKGGGVQKYELVSGIWTLQYTLAPETAGTAGARSIAVDFSGANPIVYGVTTEATQNILFGITDSGSTSTATDFATAPANIDYRSIAFAPADAPEPATIALLGLGVAGVIAMRRRK